MARNVCTKIALVAQDRSYRRMYQGRIGPVTGLNIINRPFVIAFFSDDTAYQRSVVHLLGQLGQGIRDLNPCRRSLNLFHTAADSPTGVWVKRFQLAWTAF